MYFFFYFPLGAESPTHRFPVLTWGLALVLLGVHLFVHSTAAGEAWFPRLVLHASEPNFVQAFTACFVHADLVHLVGNLFYLITFGPLLEDRIPRPTLLAVYLLTGLASMLLQTELRKATEGVSDGVLLGASGAIAGLLGLTLVRAWFARIRVAHATFAYLRATTAGGVIGLPAWLAVAVWGGLQVVYTTVSLETGGGETAHWAHLGGLGGGILLGLAGGQLKEGVREKRLESARRYMRLGSWHAAVGEYETYRRGGGQAVEALFDEARCLRLAGKEAEAAGAYDEGLDRLLEEERWEEAASVIEEREKSLPGGGGTASQLIAVAEAMQAADEPMRAATLFEMGGQRARTAAVAVGALERAAGITRHVVGDLERTADLFELAAERVEREATGRTPRSLDLRQQANACRRVYRNRMRFAAPGSR